MRCHPGHWCRQLHFCTALSRKDIFALKKETSESIINSRLQYTCKQYTVYTYSIPNRLYLIIFFLFNYILDVGIIPKQWKKGEITPVYKKDCSLSKDNYRPLTILPALSKVFETLVHSRVSPRFRNILHKFVFAYRKHHG